uniref:EIF-4F 25 kDa subunit n=1 Tax=Clastoptera arizonana TaxID=38151 RepID=A0A1B6EE16_9HEMI
MASSENKFECESGGFSPVFSSSDIEKLKNNRDVVPLQTPWTFWLDRSIPGDSAEQYQANLKKIYTVSTVHEFWAVFNNIPTTDKIPNRFSYHLMRNEIKPLWEDKENIKGGTWRLKCNKLNTNRVWQELLLAAIGEQFSDCVHDADQICGVSVTVRDKDDLVQVWNVNADLANDKKVLPKIHHLVPEVEFTLAFYKRHQNHHAFNTGKKLKR